MSKARDLADLLATVAVQSDLPTAVSDLTNDTGFITATHTGNISITGTLSATGQISSDADVVAYASS